MRIPKRIIHIYSVPEGRPEELPLVSRAALANARLLHPGFELVLFNRSRIEAFINDEFPEFRAVFQSIRLPIQRFDFFRYLAVFRLGGFYLDLDVFLAEALDPLLEFECVFPFEELTVSAHLRQRHGMDWELANYGFGAAPGAPFLRAVIDNCVRGFHEPAWAEQMMKGIPRPFRTQFRVPMTTGPGLVSRTFAEQPQLQAGVTVLFPPDVCDEKNWQRFGRFGVHLMQASWRRRDGFLRSRLARIWESRKRAALLQASRALGPTRTGPWSCYP